MKHHLPYYVYHLISKLWVVWGQVITTRIQISPTTNCNKHSILISIELIFKMPLKCNVIRVQYTTFYNTDAQTAFLIALLTNETSTSLYKHYHLYVYLNKYYVFFQVIKIYWSAAIVGNYSPISMIYLNIRKPIANYVLHVNVIQINLVSVTFYNIIYIVMANL